MSTTDRKRQTYEYYRRENNRHDYYRRGNDIRILPTGKQTWVYHFSFLLFFLVVLLFLIFLFLIILLLIVIYLYSSSSSFSFFMIVPVPIQMYVCCILGWRIGPEIPDLRRGAAKSLAFPISYFPTCSTTKRIFLDGFKKLEQRSHKECGIYGESYVQ
jgi:hypothetical protein